MHQDYIEPVFRPPSEGRSLILQITNGCSWNHCTFCEMYTQDQKKFRFKSFADIDIDLFHSKQSESFPKKVFLADGDAMTLSTRRLTKILILINKHYPDINRISSYCLPRNIKHKSVTELKALRELGLKMVYVGCESGDDLVLEHVHKGETYLSQCDALLKLKDAGIKTSVMILNGLGGQKFWRQHATHSAQLMNECQPDYLSTLVVSFPKGLERFKRGFKGQFSRLTQLELFEEMELFLENLQLNKTVFRSDHASNYLVLKGILGRDKDNMLEQVKQAIAHPEISPLRQEWQRGL